MTETQATTPTQEAPAVAGLLAQFDSPERLLAAAEKIRDAGYRSWDAHSPYPVHGIERAMGIRPTILPWLVLGAGITGAAVALLMQWWMNAVDYPVIISGKPLFSLPANIPVTFELIVLFSAFAAFGGVLVLNQLPQFWHHVFSSKIFARATSDGFFISIDAKDPMFHLIGTRKFLNALGAENVDVCYQPSIGKSIPKTLYWAGAFAVILALLPPLLIARARLIPSDRPRIHIVPDMDFQPRYQSQAASPYFDDHRAMRPSVAGTIAVGQLDTDDHLFRGKLKGDWAKTFPMPVSQQMIDRGRDRYNIYCATCHGWDGSGKGMTALRVEYRQASPSETGYSTWVPPQTLHKASVVQQPVGQLYNTVTNGLNTMPSYAAQIPVDDRWAIVLYVRALQRSQNARVEDVPASIQVKLELPPATKN